ncbi:helix-turn-helix domain-containing protein [Streptomyces sp. A1136]|uniref:helix-turn-helix domain-containing protein n=1 Tax=Streptomyces sp. A1136 TaxID=2563102 RepID=UPI00109E42AC|nr:helix-turn-helix transcriptional regulator [Streptomyces sp. A1136]THA56173.1 XRE family transcriptional regulator [Streptomyces sp. A1136]
MTGDIGDFLRSRRARIRPEETGLPSHGRRRVPGLRREEVALLAGVSVDYYIRLEQGRGPSVSDAVLDAIARVLRLNPTEHSHLRALARPPVTPEAVQEVRPGVRLLLEAVGGAAPAFVLGRRMDVLAWNALADAVAGHSHMPPGSRNIARHVFLDPDARELYPQWARIAEETVGHLRLYAGQHPGDPLLAALTRELADRSEEFRLLWADHTVKEKTHGVKLIDHPVVGRLELPYETLALPGEPDQLLVVYTAPPGSETAHRLARLAAEAPGAPLPRSGVPLSGPAPQAVLG